jgi:transcriptional regulator with XRE-family HTH domain
MKTHTYDEVYAALMADPAFREVWVQEAFAWAVSIEILRYRIAHDLTQEQFAAHLGTSLEVVAELEDGEETPILETLLLLSERLGLKFAITVDPPESSTPRDTRPAIERARIAGAVAAA